MASTDGLSAQSLVPPMKFNWVFLVELLVCGFVTLFFLFYFNRAFAKFISLVVRIYLRWKRLPHYVDIESLQISLLAGRIFFGQVVYHGTNETITVVGGQVTWRYWLRRVRHASAGTPAAGTAKSDSGGEHGSPATTGKMEDLPCRVLVELRGLEWIIYNRSPAYDAIVEQMAQGPPPPLPSDEDQNAEAIAVEKKEQEREHAQKLRANLTEAISTQQHPVEKNSKDPLLKEYGDEPGDEGVDDFLTDISYIRMLPVKVECNKGAVVMGNNNVPSILVAHFERAEGVVDAARSRSIDKYKQIFDITFTHPVIQLKTNADYKEPLLSRGTRLLSTASPSNPLDNSSKAPNTASTNPISSVTSRMDAFKTTKIASADRKRLSRRQKLREMIPLFTQSVESLPPSETSNPDVGGNRANAGRNQDKWMGLSRYLDDLGDEGRKFEPVEYAKFSTILDCPKARMNYYWDVAGLVPASSRSRTNSAGTNGFPNTSINGSRHPPPEWGIDLSFDGGTIHYGPWADRQRVHLQNMFFPRLYKSATPAAKLSAGHERVPTEFKLFVELNKSTILRIPIREESKDWKYKKRRRTEGANDVSGSGATPSGEVRPFGWLEIKVAPESTISYSMAMVAAKSGWKNGLNLELRSPEVRTSVNHHLLYKADWQGLECDLSNPLQWNGQATWTFDNVSRGMKAILLREHVTLMTDLVTDWASGPLAEYATFQPFLYDLKLKLDDWEVSVNVNDQNIINNPGDFEDNAFLMLKSRSRLQVDVWLDMTKFRPEESTVSFEARIVDDMVTPDPAGNRKGLLELALRQPGWNSWNCFLKQPENNGGSLATAEDFVLTGRYNYFHGLGSDLIDTLEMNIEGKKLKMVVLGVLIRYFLILRENYFGENLHFKTSEEWQKLHQPRTGDDSEVMDLQEEIGKSNDLDMLLSVQVRECSLLLPKNVYDLSEGLRLDLPILTLDLRFTNYYMDLQVDLSPIAVSHGAIFCAIGETSTPKPQLFVDGLTIYGHRLFGLPPTEPTYICNWDLNVGDVTGDCVTPFLQASILALKAFIFGFEDVENALPIVELPVIYDATFVRIGVKSLKIWLHIEGDDAKAFRITTGELKFVLNDLANGKWSDRIDLAIPALTMACVDIYSPSSSPMTLSSRKEKMLMEEHLGEVLGKKKPLGYIETELKMTVFGRKRDMARKRRLQMKHIRESDARTGRAAFLIRDEGLPESRDSSFFNEIVDQEPPSMSLPMLPVPIADDVSPGYQSFGEPSIEYDVSSRMSETSERKSSTMDSRSSLFMPSLRRAPSSIAPSFHSALESLSDLPPAGSSTHLNAPASPNLLPTKLHGRKGSSNTTGRSRYESSSPSEERSRRARSPDILFSSTFVKPAFPLDGVELDLRDVPELGGSDVGEGEDMTASYVDSGSFIDENTAQNSIVVEFTPGIKGYCTPMALKNVVGMLFSLQAKRPEDMLDAIQISVVDRLAELAANKLSHPTILELYVKIPQLKFCFTNPIPESFLPPAASPYRLEMKGEEDVYTVELHRLTLAGRSKKAIKSEYRDGRPMTETVNEKEVLSLHVLLHSLGVTLNKVSSGRMSELSAGPALSAVVEDILFWASTNEGSTASLQVKDITSSLESKQIVFLYEIFRRTAIMVEELQTTFSMLGKYEKRRTQDLVYYLSAAGEDPGITHNPTCLTKLSSVLRSSLDHVRFHDSWKINTRLRHVYQSLLTENRDELVARCEHSLGQPPADAKKLVVDVFARWNWELTDVENCFIITDTFGAEEKTMSSSSAGEMRAKVVLEAVKFLVDPGPTQHQFLVNNLVTGISGEDGVSDGITSESRAIVTSDLTPATTTVVHVHCRNTELSLAWEVLEIVEHLSKFLSTQEKAGARTPPKSSVKSVQPSTPKRFHVVITTETGTIKLDTVNLKMSSMAHNLQASLVIGEKGETPEGLHTRMLLRADLASSELCYGNKVLSMTRLRNPSLYVHFHENSVAETDFNMWKIAGSCEELSFDIREEILGLVEVTDFLVNDEVSQIYQLVKKIKEVPPLSSTRVAANPRVKEHWVDLALNLEKFTLGATLLPSLSYLVRGSGVRLSTRPKHYTEMIIDFDVPHHEHEIRTRYDDSQTRSISVLQLPAINGRVRDCDSSEERLLEVFISVEAIKLDASAIQSLVNALNKPEVVNVIEEARAEWKGTQGRLDEILDAATDTPASSLKSGTPLIYRAHAGVAGLKVITSAPSANLEVDLGSIQVHASNRPKADMPLLALPEFHLEFRRITVELTRAMADGQLESCGYVELHASLLCTSKTSPMGKSVRAFHVKSNSLRIDLFAETASTVVDVVGHLQDKLRDLDLSREVKYLRKLRNSKPNVSVQDVGSETDKNSIELFASAISVEMMGIQVSWIVGNSGNLLPKNYPRQNLVLSFKRIYFATATRKENEARLIIEKFLLQMIDAKETQIGRSENSALLPEVVFNVAYFGNVNERRFAFQAKGTSLDLRLTSSCVIGASDLESSIATASEKFRDASAMWKSTPTKSGAERKNMFGSKRLASVLVDADFAGAVVHLSNDVDPENMAGTAASWIGTGTQPGRLGQFAQGESMGSTVMRSPGLAFKAEYRDPIDDDPSLSAEIKVNASSNTLYPSVVPLVMEMSANVKEIMREPKETKEVKKESDNGKENSQDPAAILGRCKLNVGLRICKQEFTMSCQPIARVAATAGYEEIYVTINTCDDNDGGRFYAISATIAGLQTSLQHVYSRESTGHLEVKTVVLSLMNSKHLNGSDGLSCIMNLSPIESQINLKQFQDFLLFREIWLPEAIRQSTPTPAVPSSESSVMLVQRYHKVTTTKAFPWNTTMAISEIDLQLDLGQSLGKSALLISNFWVTSRKTSDWEQIMCLGFDTIRVSSTGRLSGFVDLKNMKARTSIHWDSATVENVKTPLIEASLGFEQLQVKASFDYQAFLIADIRSFDFLMYNLQKEAGEVGDRLVGVLDGEKVQIFCTTQSASQGLAMYQALLRLAQEKMASFETSLKDVERYLTRRSQLHSTVPQESLTITIRKETPPPPTFLSLHTDVVVNLKKVNIGAFPSTFHDTQVFKLEAVNATARFAVEMDPEKEKVHSKLEMKLGQLRISLAAVKRSGIGTSLADVSVEDVIAHATASRGGTILIVPHVTAFMHTWHKAGSCSIDYIFKSAFDGKVDVGWNYSRVSFIKGMWSSHVKAMGQRQGKAVASSRISISTDITPNSPTVSELVEEEREGKKEEGKKEKGKITAVVDVPQSKYEYNALEPPVIETPQLRDMGEATPPLEWIGLHRDRLPNLTHQIVIVSLLEIAREVEDAYSKILGSS